MGLLLNLYLLIACLCVLHVYGYEENEYRRTLEAFHLMQRAQEWEEELEHGLEKRDCKALGEACRIQPKCCGYDHCFWEDGFTALKDGVCVQCVEKDQKCQKNEQCCAGLQCDKGNPLWVDGRCVEPRTSDNCYQDSQCLHDCKHTWWPPSWKCV